MACTIIGRFVLGSCVAVLVACGSDDSTQGEVDTGSSDGFVGDQGIDATGDARGDTLVDSSRSDATLGDVHTGDTDDTSATGDTPSDEVSETAVDAPSDARACTAKGGECGPSGYCDTIACATGTCKPRPTSPSLAFASTCACDGVTYWNLDQAHARGASVPSVGGSFVCASAGTPGCGGLLSTPCPSMDMKCIDDQTAFAGCIAGDVGGECWYVPPGATCPAGGSGYLDCATSSCSSLCDSVMAGHTYRRSSGC